MEWFVAVLDDLDCKIFFVGQQWWPTFEWRGGRNGEAGRGGEGRRGGREGRVGKGRKWEGITANSIENPYFDPWYLYSDRNWPFSIVDKLQTWKWIFLRTSYQLVSGGNLVESEWKLVHGTILGQGIQICHFPHNILSSPY